MTNPSQDDPKPDGAAFDDFFDSIGKKAEHLTISEQTEKKESHGFMNEDAATATGKPEEEDQRVVDEIESLCMNCREMVL